MRCRLIGVASSQSGPRPSGQLPGCRPLIAVRTESFRKRAGLKAASSQLARTSTVRRCASIPWSWATVVDGALGRSATRSASFCAFQSRIRPGPKEIVRSDGMRTSHCPRRRGACATPPASRSISSISIGQFEKRVFGHGFVDRNTGDLAPPSARTHRNAGRWYRRRRRSRLQRYPARPWYRLGAPRGRWCGPVRLDQLPHPGSARTSGHVALKDVVLR